MKSPFSAVIFASIRWRKFPKDLPRKRHDTHGTSLAFFWLSLTAFTILLALNIIASG